MGVTRAGLRAVTANATAGLGMRRRRPGEIGEERGMDLIQGLAAAEARLGAPELSRDA